MPESFPHVLNVISCQANALAAPLHAIAAEHGGAAGEIGWLAPAGAFDIPFLDRPAHLLAAARGAAGSIAADINVVPVANRRKKLLIADMESTMIDCEVIDELAEIAGRREQIERITAGAMRGEMAFEPALRERVALLKGLPVEILDRVYRQRVRLNPGAKELVATMRAHGAFTMLVSGGFSFFTERVARDCGFDRWRSNRLAVEDSKLTGKVDEPILGRDAKLRALKDAVAERSITPADAVAVGDGANDLGMIEGAGLGVAWHAKPILAQAADAIIAHGDLTSLLYLQGYRTQEIVV